MKPDPSEAAEFAALQILVNVNDRIRKMARTKITIANKPVMSPEIEEEIESALAQFTNKVKWVEWGMDTIRKQGNMVLLYGPPGCLEGHSTILQVARRDKVKKMSLRHFFYRFNAESDIPWYLHSYHDGVVFYNRVLSVLDSGVKPCLQVQFNNDETLVMTADHPVMLADGTFLQTCKLTVGTEVMVKGSMRPQKGAGKQRPAPRRTIESLKYHPLGSVKMVDGYFYKRMNYARLVYEAAGNSIHIDDYIQHLKTNPDISMFKFLPANMDVHHIDGDCMNDDLDNLEATDHAEHAGIHSLLSNFNVDYCRSAIVTNIVAVGDWHTYDIQMQSPANNFAANGVFVHNTGKTKIAEYMSKRVGRGMDTLNMKDVGGKAPGHTERMVHEVFTQARLNGIKTVFMDECEAVVWDRGRAGSDSMWMVGVIDEILMQTAKYPGLVVAATNREDIIDPALKSRCFAALQIGMPGFSERTRLWQCKIPKRYPMQLTLAQCEKLSEYEMSGRAIENAIVHEASSSIKQKRLPEFVGLIRQCKKLIAAGQAN